MHETCYTTVASAFGDLLLTDHGAGLSGLYFPQHRRGPDVDRCWVRDDLHFEHAAVALEAYFAGGLTVFELVLDMRGTPFQRQVWDRLRGIRYGSTVTYGELAAQIGRAGSARAVAAAVARNPISIIVPCHRVVAANGRLTGYAGGLQRKLELLAHESPDA